MTRLGTTQMARRSIDDGLKSEKGGGREQKTLETGSEEMEQVSEIDAGRGDKKSAKNSIDGLIRPAAVPLLDMLMELDDEGSRKHRVSCLMKEAGYVG
ncbi:hypothetical protein ACLOJK_001634 [Asimina triloba]